MLIETVLQDSDFLHNLPLPEDCVSDIDLLETTSYTILQLTSLSSFVSHNLTETEAFRLNYHLVDSLVCNARSC